MGNSSIQKIFNKSENITRQKENGKYEYESIPTPQNFVFQKIQPIHLKWLK